VFCSHWRYESLKYRHKSFYETGLYVNGRRGGSCNKVALAGVLPVGCVF
jgi:hypothetical protein